MIHPLRSLKKMVLDVRDGLAVDDLVVCADITEVKAKERSYPLDIAADFLTFALAYRLARDEKHRDVPIFVKRIKTFSGDYDPSLRFFPRKNPTEEDSFEEACKGQLAQRVGTFIARYPSFAYEKSFGKHFPLAKSIDRESIIQWFPEDQIYGDISFYG
ncbi:hypothetical protein EXS74_00385 [Candidatus Woesearchaeota archaeon]|nr:hypothetical protein [Candidatus Woesearchaeota archaeon]